MPSVLAVAGAGSPANLFTDGGALMYLILALGLAQLVGIVVQLAMARRLNLMPLLWSTLAAQICLGMLGNVTSTIAALHELARMATDTRGELFAQALSLSLFSSSGMLIFALLGCVGNGVAHSVVNALRTSR